MKLQHIFLEWSQGSLILCGNLGHVTDPAKFYKSKLEGDKWSERGCTSVNVLFERSHNLIDKILTVLVRQRLIGSNDLMQIGVHELGDCIHVLLTKRMRSADGSLVVVTTSKHHRG